MHDAQASKCLLQLAADSSVLEPPPPPPPPTALPGFSMADFRNGAARLGVSLACCWSIFILVVTLCHVLHACQWPI